MLRVVKYIVHHGVLNLIRTNDLSPRRQLGLGVNAGLR